jgi:NAD(P)-dependent dehydrogenase (short-subunit alcohol dehydrogenase family)
MGVPGGAVHAVNPAGIGQGCRFAIRAMGVKGAGSIINISSRSGPLGILMAVARTLTKAAIRRATRRQSASNA